MIFYALDLYYENNPSDELGIFLGAMSPFTFKEIDSADSAIYEEFCEIVNKESIEIEESYDLAKDYLKSIENIDVYSFFCEVTTKKQWVEGCKEYLESEHKGSRLSE